jgi:hypothetical protein
VRLRGEKSGSLSHLREALDNGLTSSASSHTLPPLAHLPMIARLPWVTRTSDLRRRLSMSTNQTTGHNMEQQERGDYRGPVDYLTHTHWAGDTHVRRSRTRAVSFRRPVSVIGGVGRRLDVSGLAHSVPPVGGIDVVVMLVSWCTAPT